MQLWQPESKEEALALMKQYKRALVLAGGCWTRLGNRAVAQVIDLAKAGLGEITETEDGIYLGAMASLRAVECDEAVKAYCGGVLAKAITPILGVQFRNMATIGGTVAGKFGFSDVIPVLLALGAEVVTAEGGQMSLADYMDYRERDLLCAVVLPKSHGGRIVAFEALRKSASDFPYLTGALAYDGDSKTYSMYVGCRPGRAEKAVRCSELLSQGGKEAVDAAVEAVASDLAYQSNSHASGEYRQLMAKGLVKRLVQEVGQ